MVEQLVVKILDDEEDRERKANKIIAILADYLGSFIGEYNCLDLGCSKGIISLVLSRYFRQVTGVDIDNPAVRLAVKNASAQMVDEPKPNFCIGSGGALPFPDYSFDVVVCAQVYEHVIDQPALAREVERVLRPGGVCFFSGPNRYAVMEEHYWLPFLSWLPRRIASAYMRLFKRGDNYDAYPLSYAQIRRLWKNFIIHDYNLRLLREPTRFSVAERVNKYFWIRFLPDFFFRILRPFYPNYNWILIKPNE